MLLLRKLIFYIFALIYLVICPLIVARMLGFVFNPQTHRIEKTGLVYISTIPPNANVYIDGLKEHEDTPLVVRDLTPGNHFIRIELDGYNNWEQDVAIIGRQATVLANTLLIPQQWPIKTVSDQPYQNIVRADDDILVANSPLLKNITLFRTTADFKFQEPDIPVTGKNLFSANSIYADGHLVHLYSAHLSPYVLLEAIIKDKPKFLWIKLNENPPLIEDISDLFPETPIRIAWDNSDNANIFAFCQPNVYRINVKDKAIYPQDPGNLPRRLDQRPLEKQQEQLLINDKNDLLSRQGRWIKLYPLQEFGTPQVYTIAQSRASTNMYFEDRNGELFYLDQNGLLNVVQILPYHPILNIPIPDGLKAKLTTKESDL